MMDIPDLHAYWRNPPSLNSPDKYATAPPERAQFLLDLLRDNFDESDHVLELGCNSGRNLKALDAAGYRASGIDINSEAIAQCHASDLDVIQAVIPDDLMRLWSRSYDVVFTMAVLEHIHPDAIERTIWHMARLARHGIITIELESRENKRVIAHDYPALFAKYGFREIDHRSPPEGAKLGGYVARVLEPRH